MLITNVNIKEARAKTRKKRTLFFLKVFVVSLISVVLGFGIFTYKDNLQISQLSSFFAISQEDVKSKEDRTDSSQVSGTPKTPELYEVTHTTYYAFVSSHKNNKLTYTSEDIRLIDKILVLCDKNLQLPKFESESISFVNEKLVCNDNLQLIDNKIKQTNSIALIPVDQLNFGLKVVDFEGSYIFDKNLDLVNYPLQTKMVIKKEEDVDLTNLKKEQVTRVGHTGSLISPRGVQYHIETFRGGDYKHIFKDVVGLFNSMDYLTSTFEAPLLGNGVPCDRCMTFIGPEKFMEGVVYSGIDLISLAANHIMDGGDEALNRTMSLLKNQNIPHIGASLINNNQAGEPYLAEVNGLKIAYIALNDTPGYGQWAGDAKSGAANISDIEIVNGVVTKYEPNIDRIKFFVDRSKQLNPDYVAVIMHWGGQEYVNGALEYQELLASLLVENGVDIILGDHVHWVQEIQYLDKPQNLEVKKEVGVTHNNNVAEKNNRDSMFGNKAPVFYGVGNFIFDQMWSIETRQGMTIEMIFLDKKLVSYRLHPHQLYLYDEGIVKLLNETEPEYEETLNCIWEVSDDI